jgi:hypothetical protein
VPMRSALPYVAVLVVCTATASAAMCCPFCEAPSLTLTEQLNQADVAVLVQYVESKSADREQGFAGETTYEVVDVVHDAAENYKHGGRIKLDRDRAAKRGDLFLLLGTKAKGVEWSSPLEVSETSFQYMKQAPPKEANTSERLKYFVRFLEYPDPLVASDAYSEFANAPYKDITPIADTFPREKLREWLTDSDTPATRLGLYGLMLGLAGNDEDAELMKQKITESTQDFRLGIDGIMAGYLLLEGEDGLQLIDDTKLRDADIPFSETYAGMQALRFLWTYAPERVSKERLRESMRILLERPDLADLVVTDLARWEDWSITDKLWEIYHDEEYNIPSIKRAIVRFFLVAERAKTDDMENPQPLETAEQAKEYVATLRAEDPKTVQAAERFFFLN